MVNGLFKIRTLSKVLVHTNDQIVLIVLVKDEETGLHMCAKRIFDRSSSFEIIDQKACRSYGEQASSYIYSISSLKLYTFVIIIYGIHNGCIH
jgi:hypothetical protein